jgi:hypothetical protein
VENQAAADERIPLLLRTPAATRFISVEPMLGKVTLPYGSLPVGPGFCLQREQILWCDKALDWVICGGESGPHARPMHPDWARSLRDQCAAAQVPFFFKQWGEWAEVEREYPDERFSPRMVQRGDAFVTPSGAYDLLGSDLRSTHELDGLPMRRVGKKAAGSLLDGLKYKSFPISER